MVRLGLAGFGVVLFLMVITVVAVSSLIKYCYVISQRVCKINAKISAKCQFAHRKNETHTPDKVFHTQQKKNIL